MAALGAQSIASSYEQLLHVDRDGGGNSTTHVSVKDGDNGTTFGFTIATDALMMSSTNRLEFGDTGTYIHQSADGVLDLVSDTEIEINATTIDINGAVAMDGAMTGGTNITISGELDAATLDISGNADIAGTTNLDAVDIDGNVQLDGTFTIGTDGSGQDVTFYSATSGDSFAWDASEEKLTITGTNGQTALDVADGNLVVADNIDLEGDIDVNGTANLDNTDIDGTLAVDGTTISFDATTSLNIDNSNTSNGITIGTATSGVPISIGHTTSETTVNDNLVVTGDIDLAGSIDVDGTANLDVVDIDGAVDMASTLAVNSTTTIKKALSSDTQSTPETVLKLGTTYTNTGGTDGAAGSGTRIEFEIPDDDTNPITGSAIAGLKENGDDGVSNSALVFYVSQDDTTLDEAMRIESDGTVTTQGAFQPAGNITCAGDVTVNGGDVTISNSGGHANLNIDAHSNEGSDSAIAFRSGTTERGYIYYDHNTTAASQAMVFNTGDNAVTAAKIMGDGSFLAPKNPAFLAQPASNQLNFAENTNVTVVLGTERFDQGSNFASNTFTAPVTGKYQLSAMLYMENIELAAEYYEMKIVTSNRSYFKIFSPGGLDTDDLQYWGLSIAVLADMDASDTATLQIRQGGTSQDETADLGVQSFFSGYLAC